MGAQKVHLSTELASNEAAGVNMSTPADVGDIAFSTNYLAGDLSTMALQKGKRIGRNCRNPDGGINKSGVVSQGVSTYRTEPVEGSTAKS